MILKSNGMVSGPCVKCEYTVYESESQFKDDEKVLIHWGCKVENQYVVNQDIVIEWLVSSEDLLSGLVGLQGSCFGLPEKVGAAFEKLSYIERVEVIKKASDQVLVDLKYREEKG